MSAVATVILANGDFPAPGTAARRLLDEAQRIVACDGAADALFALSSRIPDAIVGDLDSISAATRDAALAHGVEIVRVAEQETNDLAKAARLCRERSWWPPLILGAAGKREDHTIANLFLALDLGLEAVTDRARFAPVPGDGDWHSFAVAPGAAVSIFAPCPNTRVRSKGLEWPLDGVALRNLHCAALNRATSSTVSLASNRPVLACLNF